MKENRFHEVDKQASREIRDRLLTDGITEYPVACDYCDDEGMVETDNNGPIGTCPICGGSKAYMLTSC